MHSDQATGATGALHKRLQYILHTNKNMQLRPSSMAFTISVLDDYNTLLSGTRTIQYASSILATENGIFLYYKRISPLYDSKIGNATTVVFTLVDQIISYSAPPVQPPVDPIFQNVLYIPKRNVFDYKLYEAVTARTVISAADTIHFNDKKFKVFNPELQSTAFTSILLDTNAQLEVFYIYKEAEEVTIMSMVAFIPSIEIELYTQNEKYLNALHVHKSLQVFVKNGQYTAYPDELAPYVVPNGIITTIKKL